MKATWPREVGVLTEPWLDILLTGWQSQIAQNMPIFFRLDVWGANSSVVSSALDAGGGWQGAAAQSRAAAAALPSGPGSAGVTGSGSTFDPELEQLFGAGYEAELDALFERGATAQPVTTAASLPSGPGSADLTGSGSTFDPELEQLFGAGYEVELDALFETGAAVQPGAVAAALPSGPGSAGMTGSVSTFDSELEQLFGVGYGAELDAIFEKFG